MKNSRLILCMLFISLVFVGLPVKPESNISTIANSPLPTPVSASEEENIDTFNVHPASGRWDITNVGFSSEIWQGALNMYDTGDGTGDYYSIVRGLRDLDDKIEIKFKYQSSLNSTDTDDQMLISLTDIDTSGMSFYIQELQDKNYSMVVGAFHDGGGTFRTQTLAETGSSDGVYENEWYILEIDYDLLRGEIEWDLEFMNGTDVLSWDWQDIWSSGAPRMFEKESLSLQIRTYSKTNNIVLSGFVDYVDAPFKERDWVQVDTPSDADYLEDHWDLCHCQDDIQDDSEWWLTVPYLDSFSGTAQIDFETPANIADNDIVSVEVKLFGVDADDGDYHEIHGLYLLSAKFAGTTRTYMTIYENGSSLKSSAVNTGKTSPKVEFSFKLTDDRSVSSLKVRFYPDLTGSTYEDYYAEVDVSDCVVDPSSEFIISVEYSLNFYGNTECFMEITSFDMLERSIFDGIWSWITDTGNGIVSFFQGLFATVFRFLAEIFVTIGGLIIDAVDALAPLITTMQGVLEGAIGLVEDAIGALEPLLGVIEDAIEAIWSTLEPVLGDVIEWLFDALFLIVDIVVDFLADLTFYVWDTLWETVLGFSEAPDFIAIIYSLGTGFIQFIIGIPTFVDDFGFYVQNTFNMIAWLGVIYFLILPVIEAKEIGDFFEIALDHFGKDITMGMSIFGFHIPIPAGLVWLLVLITGPLSGTSYAGFFP